MQIIVGIIAVLIGAGMVVKTEWIIQNFGTNAWAEEKLGYNGGSRLLYKCIGIIFVLLGFLMITGLFEGFLMATLGKVFIR